LENGLAFDPRLLIHVEETKLYPDLDPIEFQRMKDSIRQAGEFTAYYAQNNRTLNSGIKSIIDLGKDADSLQFALHINVSKPLPPYTDKIPHVVPPIYEMGIHSAKLLLSNIREKSDVVSHIFLKNRIEFENLPKPFQPVP